MSVPSDIETTARIRTRLYEGALPGSADNQKIYAGYGEQQTCDCCGRVIGSADVLYEIELPSQRPWPLAMHLKCFTTWVAESQFKSALEATAPAPAVRRAGSATC
jgi:hypothetical protein